MNLNKVQLAGRLTRDPEIKYTQGGTAIADFSMAVSRFWKNDKGENQEEVDYIDCTAFGRTAETIQKHLGKGRAVYVEGRLKLEQWEKDGQKRSKLKVVAESMQFVGPRPQADRPQAESPAPAAAKAAAATRPAPTPADNEPSDIPF
jgi:single-strand DNA-binding protein